MFPDSLLIRLLPGPWQYQRSLEPATLNIRELNPATVRLCNIPGYTEPKANATGIAITRPLDAEKGLKNLL